MMPHCKRESQFELFETLSPAATAAAPKLALPFQSSEEIDLQRFRKILGISGSTARRMLHARTVRSYPGPSGLRLEYDSVIAYCSRLRLHYRIPERRLPRAGGRLGDRDLLPFPLDETIYVSEITEILRCSTGSIISLIDEGKLTAYQIAIDTPGCPWRVWRTSLQRYVESLHAAAAPTLQRSAAHR
jgi:hypothetical protein